MPLALYLSLSVSPPYWHVTSSLPRHVLFLGLTKINKSARDMTTVSKEIAVLTLHYPPNASELKWGRVTIMLFLSDLGFFFCLVTYACFDKTPWISFPSKSFSFFFLHLSHICKKCSRHMDQSKCNPGFLSKYLLIWHQHTKVTDWNDENSATSYFFFYRFLSVRLALSIYVKSNNVL